MKQRPLLWQLYPGYISVILITLIFMFFTSTSTFRTFYFQETSSNLKARTILLEHQVIKLVKDQNVHALPALLKTLGAQTNTRYTIINHQGVVLADSIEQAMHMDNHANRPEIKQALDGPWGHSVRYSRTIRQHMFYIAKPVTINNKIFGVIRSALPRTELDLAIASIKKQLIISGILICLFSAFIGFIVSKNITKPIKELTQGADQFSKGNFDFRLKPSKTWEFNTVVQALNNMANQLNERIQAITQQSNEKEAILTNMVEGIITIDKDQRLSTINTAARKYFIEDAEDVIGKPLPEVIRNLTILQLAEKTKHTPELLEEELTLHSQGEFVFHAHAIALENKQNQYQGALFVFHDITQLKKLENIRKNFVSNVSHELKTPVTLIKGFLETLQKGAVDKKAERDEFLEIIHTHADRLEHIIEDLLTLSRIEQENEDETIDKKPEQISLIIHKSISSCTMKAKAKLLTIEYNPSFDINLNVNFSLIEQALINLIDNAIKYSPQKGKIDITMYRDEHKLSLTVKDNGCGIPDTHIPRLFERFYRVDKARSRELGGTGLGLSIVKHIAQAHNGSVSAKSKIGEGSEFSIHLPLTT